MPRPVHYTAAGVNGLVFDCYRREFTLHVNEYREREGAARLRGELLGRVRFTHPTPRRTTNLDQVTCRDCWHAIRVEAEARLQLQEPHHG